MWFSIIRFSSAVMGLNTPSRMRSSEKFARPSSISMKSDADKSNNQAHDCACADSGQKAKQGLYGNEGNIESCIGTHEHHAVDAGVEHAAELADRFVMVV